MKKIIIVVLLLTSFNSKADTLLYTALAFHVLDYRQTYLMMNSGGRYLETNGFLGKQPSNKTLHAYFLGTGLTMLGIRAILPPRPKKYFTFCWAFVGGAYVSGNLSIGVKF